MSGPDEEPDRRYVAVDKLGFTDLMAVATLLLERHYPAEFFNRENPHVGDDPGTKLVVALRECMEAMERA